MLPAALCADASDAQPQQSGTSSSSGASTGAIDKQADDEQWYRYSRALAAAAANPQQQVVQQPTEAIMVLYFKKHLQRHMTAIGLAGTEHMSLLSACSALEAQRTTCTQNAVRLVACAMEELRQEAERGEKRTDEVLAWDLAHAIAEQHECEQQHHQPSLIEQHEHEHTKRARSE